MTDAQTTDAQTISNAVAQLYNTYPFPPEPLSDSPPPGYNWRWHWGAAHQFCLQQKPATEQIRILDAGCGTGVGTEYLVYLNPQAQVIGIDLSTSALKIAQERCDRSQVALTPNATSRVTFQPLSLYDVGQLPGEFNLINCVGVLHHLPDPIRGIQALASKLAPGGLMHIFVYAELGRWEIQLMQQAIALLQTDTSDYRDGVTVGRQLFASLPENNRLVKREQERWSLENQRDECFADMYVHPQEIDYSIPTLFELIDAAGLEFLGFSNPRVWQLERLVGRNPDLMERASHLSDRQRYRLIELLDPETITHYEFFLGRPPLYKADWSPDVALLAAIPERNPCMDGWDSRCLFNYDYQLVNLSEAEWQFLKACDQNTQARRTVGEILTTVPFSLGEVRSLLAQQLILLTPSSN
jgi:2-polyprenyl-3-methyl-5-hydroxy-6-metoxy-1,4-benzoquinol methylase